MAAQLGAHEIMELHELLTCTIDGINNFELYRPHVQDPQLSSMLDRQISFMTQEYNTMVQALSQKKAQASQMGQTGQVNPMGQMGQINPMNPMGQGPQYRAHGASEPVYGLRNPQPQSPIGNVKKISDREVASGMLGTHKASAIGKTLATLECADPQLRRLIQESISNCCEMAYETWQYMNQHQFYQVPTLAEQTTGTMLGAYQPTSSMQGMAMQEMQNMQGMRGMQGMQGMQGMHGMRGIQGQPPQYM